MLWLTEDATITCDHAGTGRVTGYAPAQSWVTVGGRRVLIRPDPEGRPINGCVIPPVAGFLPCKTTLGVQGGYSTWVTIGGQPVSLNSVWGYTMANPQTAFHVRHPGQLLVGADG